MSNKYHPGTILNGNNESVYLTSIAMNIQTLQSTPLDSSLLAGAPPAPLPSRAGEAKGKSLARGAGEVWRRLSDGFRLWRERSRMRQQLGRLDERMLRDIGISRADVFRERAKWIWQP